MSSSKTDDSLECSHSDGDSYTSGVVVGCLPTQGCIELGCILDTVLSYFWGTGWFGKGNVLLEELTSYWSYCIIISRTSGLFSSSSSRDTTTTTFFKYNSFFFFLKRSITHFRFNNDFIISVVEVIQWLLSLITSLIPVISDDTFCYLPIRFCIFLVEHHEEKIKTREEGIGETYVLSYCLVSSILTINRISSCNNRAPSI